MKLGGVLSACNDNPYYYEFVPAFVQAWRALYPSAKVRIIFVTARPERLPVPLVPYAEYLVPLMVQEGVSSVFMSQFVRILYPAIWQTPGAILTTDIDMLPMNRRYFRVPIEPIPDDAFVAFRPPSDNQIYICYTAASWRTWRQLTSLTCWQDIIERIRCVYAAIPHKERDRVGSRGWFADQLALYQYVMGLGQVDSETGLNRVHVLSDASARFNRLDRGSFSWAHRGKEQSRFITQGIVAGHFSDYHMHRPYRAHAERIRMILSWLEQQHENQS